MKSKRTIQSEFQGWPVEELKIPPFVCEPWRNDAAIRYVHRPTEPDLAGCELWFWQDHPDPGKRENEGYPQYTLSVMHEDTEQITHFEGETLDELRAALNAWYAEHVGYEPDADHRMYHGEILPLGDLMVLVGTVAYLQHKENGNFQRIGEKNDEHRTVETLRRRACQGG